MTQPWTQPYGFSTEDLDHLAVWLHDHLIGSMVDAAEKLLDGIRKFMTVDWVAIQDVVDRVWGTSSKKAGGEQVLRDVVAETLWSVEHQSTLQKMMGLWTGASASTFETFNLSTRNAVANEKDAVDGGEADRFPLIGDAMKGVADKYAWSMLDFLNNAAGLWGFVEGMAAVTAAAVAAEVLATLTGYFLVLIIGFLAGAAYKMTRLSSLTGAMTAMKPMTSREPNYG